MFKSWWRPIKWMCTLPIKIRKDLGGGGKGGILGIHIEYKHLKLIRGPYCQMQNVEIMEKLFSLIGGILPPLIRCGPYLPVRVNNFSRL